MGGNEEVIVIDIDDGDETPLVRSCIVAAAPNPHGSSTKRQIGQEPFIQRDIQNTASRSAVQHDNQNIRIIDSKPAQRPFAVQRVLSLIDDSDDEETERFVKVRQMGNSTIGVKSLITEEEGDRKSSAEANGRQGKPCSKTYPINVQTGSSLDGRGKTRYGKQDTFSDYAMALALQAAEEQEYNNRTSKLNFADKINDEDQKLAQLLQQQEEKDYLLQLERLERKKVDRIRHRPC